MQVVIAPPEILQDPEVMAMLQAFYSRSKRSINDRLEETTLDLQKIKDKLAQFYVGYGHDSIGQCGNTTFFIEDVSLPAAKALQHNTLYNGQESSTRYIDFAHSTYVDPFPLAMDYDNGETKQSVIKHWIDLYDATRSKVYAWLVETQHSDDFTAEEQALFNKACAAKAFDIARVFLPAGVTTNVSWTTSLATMNRELIRLFAHPLLEVRQIALEIHNQVKETYPSVYKSFETIQEQVQSQQAFEYHYTTASDGSEYYQPQAMAVNLIQLRKAGRDPAFRAKYGRASHSLHSSSLVTANSTLDYASYRDVQRHRTLNPSAALLQLNASTSSIIRDPGSFFNQWYIDVLKSIPHAGKSWWEEVQGEVASLLVHAQKLKFEMLQLSEVQYGKLEPVNRQENFLVEVVAPMQYYLPIGLDVYFDNVGLIGDWVTTVELRSGETVHPTVRMWASQKWSDILHYFDDSKALLAFDPHVKEFDSDSLIKVSFRRAKQDIIEKKE